MVNSLWLRLRELQVQQRDLHITLSELGWVTIGPLKAL